MIRYESIVKTKVFLLLGAGFVSAVTQEDLLFSGGTDDWLSIQ